MKILIADDHLLFADAIARVFQARGDHVSVYKNGTNALAQLEREKYSIVLLDWSMPGGGAMGLGDFIRYHEKTPVLVVSGHTAPAIVTRAFEVGAKGFLGKQASSEVLLGAVDALVAGERFVDPAVAGLLSRPTPNLSPRERMTAKLIAQGYTNKQIAESIGVGVKSVETYRSRAWVKLGVTSRSDAIRAVTELGLLVE